VASASGPVVIYDGGCRFCRACRSWLEQRVRVGWVEAEDWPSGQSGIAASDLSASVYAVDNERVAKGSDAIAVALRAGHSRRWRVVGRFLVLPGISMAAQALYVVVARNRGRLSRLIRWYQREAA
jgi:predicted DCC family thiol-disulfide oxidoreductase YuxK